MVKDFAKAIHDADLPLRSDEELLAMMEREDAREPEGPANDYEGDPDYEQ